MDGIIALLALSICIIGAFAAAAELEIGNIYSAALFGTGSVIMGIMFLSFFV